MAHTISLRNGRFHKTTRADLEAAFQEWDVVGGRLVVHFHGGLVNREAGMKIAERLQPVYHGAGGFPLFVVWESGFGETIVKGLDEISTEKIFKRLLARVLQFTIGKALETGTKERGIRVDLPDLRVVYGVAFSAADVEPYADLPEDIDPLSDTQEDQALDVLQSDAVIQDESAKIAASLQREAGAIERDAASPEVAFTRMSPEVLAEIEAKSGTGERGVVTTARLIKGALMTIKRVLSRLRSGRGHGVYATAVEELLREFYITNAGRLVWDQMKHETAAAFGSDPAQHGGAALLQELAARNVAGAPPVLVGHSAGAVYVCNFLAHADKVLPKGQKFDLVMLAPACDFKLMDRTFTQHGERIGRLRLFCMKDEKERGDRLVPAVYPRSLLYFVSGALEAEADWPLLGMERFHAGDPPFSKPDFPEIERVRLKIAAQPASAVWSVATGQSGMASGAVHHGSFDDDVATLESVCHFISAD